MLARSRNAFIFLTTFTLIAATLVGAAQEQPKAAVSGQPQQQQPPATQEVTVQLSGPTSLTEALLLEIEVLRMELAETRTNLAQARLKADTAQRELDELRQFVTDHQRFGNDFEQYRSVKQAADREARARENAAAREQKAAEKAERDAQRAAARSAADARNAEANRVGRYKRMGFTPLGLDVYNSKMAFYYNTKEEGGGVQIDYDRLIGDYLRSFPPITEVDYSKMTISGSVLNASDLVRNIGVAITFFDESGNQVGHETIEIKNARPDVPYPFTSKIDMALNRAFASSSTYVLYADEVE